MKRYINTNPAFGSPGPFEGRSPMDVATTKSEVFIAEARRVLGNYAPDRDIIREALRLQNEYIEGLEEVEE